MISLSFSKLVMMSFTPARSVGMPDTHPKIHSLIVPYSLDFNLFKECVLTTSNAIKKGGEEVL